MMTVGLRILRIFQQHVTYCFSSYLLRFDCYLLALAACVRRWFEVSIFACVLQMYDSLRQIRNSASKKQLNKIFERKEQEENDFVDSSSETSYNSE